MKITFVNKQKKVKLPSEVKKQLLAALKVVGKQHGLDAATEVDVTIVDDEEIHRLNKEYRQVDRPTDVLSFALDEGEEPELKDAPAVHLLGDIIISAETALRQAEEYGHGLKRELAYLAVHGCLHLLGFDHMQEEDKRKMRAEEERALKKLSLSQADIEKAMAAEPAAKEVGAPKDEEASKKEASTKDTSKKDAKPKTEETSKKDAKSREAEAPETEAGALDKKLVEKLVAAAVAARKKAYAPYSKFKVGAALLTKSGAIFTGCNVENASYGLTICAERNCMFTAVAAGDQEFEVLCVAADTKKPVVPCGACLQVMAEFKLPRVILANCKGKTQVKTLAELLPCAFTEK